MSMERLTGRTEGGTVYLVNDPETDIYGNFTSKGYEQLDDVVDRIAAYEDITHPDGNEIISMERLREMVEADKDRRVVILPKPLTVTDMDMIRDIGRIVSNLEGMEAAAALAGKDGGNE